MPVANAYSCCHLRQRGPISHQLPFGFSCCVSIKLCIRDELDPVCKFFGHRGRDQCQFSSEISPFYAGQRFDCDSGTAAVSSRDEKIENMGALAAIMSPIADRRRLLLDVVHIWLHEHRAEEAVFQHTFEVDYARSLKSWKLCNHAATQASLGSAHNFSGRAASLRGAVNLIISHMCSDPAISDRFRRG